MKTTPIRTSTGYVCKACYGNGVSHHPLLFTETQVGEWESFIVKSREGFRCWRVLGGEAGGGLTRIRAPYVVGLERIFGFLWLVLRQRQEQNLGKMAIMN